jgi:hypothetical protein
MRSHGGGLEATECVSICATGFVAESSMSAGGNAAATGRLVICKPTNLSTDTAPLQKQA